MTKWILTSFVACVGFAFQAQAHDMSKGPCAKDVQTYCASAGTDRGAIMKCMMENKDKLSAECKAQHEKMKAAMKEVKEACHEDYEKFCGDVEPGGGAIKKCMKQHEQELSQNCKDEVNKMKKKKHHG